MLAGSMFAKYSAWWERSVVERDCGCERGTPPDTINATKTIYNLMIALRRVGKSEEASKLAIRMREQLEVAKDEEVKRNRYGLFKMDAPTK